MTTLRRCPVCRSTVNSTDSTHCPACGAVLGRAFSDAENITVDDIIKKVKQQIVPPEDIGDTQRSRPGTAEHRDIAEILSESAFQSILKENRGEDEEGSAEEHRSVPETPADQAGVCDGADSGQSYAGLDDAAEEREAPFSTVLGSFKQADPVSGVDDVPHDTAENNPEEEFNTFMTEEDSPAAEGIYPGRPEQPKPAAPKPRTWWGFTRQTLWLLLVLLLCIVFFRIFGPEKKKATIEDFFQPGNPDIEFLDAIEFFEKYYENQRKKTNGNKGIPTDEASVRGMQLPPQADGPSDDHSVEAPDTTPGGNSFSPASRGSLP